MMKFLLTTLLTIAAFWSIAQTAPVNTPQDTTQALDIHKVPIGPTFAKQINELVTMQQQATAKLDEIVAVIREQAGLDTTYQLRGITPQGQAVYIQEPKKQVP